MELRIAPAVCSLLAALAVTGCGSGDGPSGDTMMSGGGGGGGGGSAVLTGGQNVAPIASFTATPVVGLNALTVSLSASASSDPDGKIDKYSWNFGDASPNATGEVAQHAYGTPGQYIVTLTVTDDRGAKNSTSTTVTVLRAVSRYSVKFVPFPGADYQYMNPAAMNDAGEVVGEIDVNFDTRGFIYSGGITRQLETLGGQYTAAWGINNSGTMVGFSISPSDVQRAVRFDNDTAVDIGAWAGASAATGINATGKTVGGAINDAGQGRAVVFEIGSVIDLGTLGGSESVAYAVNDAGEVVGEAETAEGATHAFVFRNGQMEDIGTPGNDSFAIDINNSGQILGWEKISLPGESSYISLFGFIYQNGVRTEIRPADGRDLIPTAINNSTQVIGQVLESDELDDNPFVWDAVTGVRNLNELIDPAIGCRILTAVDINSSGQIVGIADCEEGLYPWEDSYVTVLLTPES